MKIEDISKAALEREDDKALYDLRLRMVNFYKKHFEGIRRRTVPILGLRHDEMLTRYAFLIKEMKSRGLKYSHGHAIDIASVRSAFVGIDVRDLEDVVVAKDFVYIIGPFAKNPKTAEFVEVMIGKMDAGSLEAQISKIIKLKTGGKEAVIAQADAELSGIIIPLFELVLKPKVMTVRKLITAPKAKKPAKKIKKVIKRSPKKAAVKRTPAEAAKELGAQLAKRQKELRTTIEKPEETATQIRIPVGSSCEVTGTIVLDATQGIRALYCGKEKRIRTYLFDKKKWTMASAKTWIKEHKAKVDVHKELSSDQRKECDAETVRIKENSKRPLAEDPHRFKAAKFTHPNGHPRCLICGDEQPVGDVCNMKADWYDTFEWDDEEAWKTERADLRRDGVIKNDWLFKIYKQDRKKQIVGGVIYEPEVVDTQGDITSAEEIQEAMYAFMEKYAQDTSRINIQHEGKLFQFPIIESFQPETDIQRGGKVVKKGSWWMMIKITNDAIWKEIEEGRLNAFSMEGTGTAQNKT